MPGADPVGHGSGGDHGPAIADGYQPRVTPDGGAHGAAHLQRAGRHPVQLREPMRELQLECAPTVKASAVAISTANFFQHLNVCLSIRLCNCHSFSNRPRLSNSPIPTPLPWVGAV